MQTLSHEAIAQGLTELLQASCNGQTALWREILLLLVQGTPVTIERLAQAMNTDQVHVRSMVQQVSKIEYNSAGQIVGAGLSLVPTKHHLQVEEQSLFTWCAFDCLAYPVVLQKTATVISTCPLTSTIITMQVGPDAVTNIEPAEAYIAVVLPSSEAICEDIRTSFCNQIHFFAARAVAEQWYETHANAIVLSIQDAYRITKQVAQQVYLDAH